jgi:hypothetical protein
LVNRVRVDRTARELDLLEGRILAWVKRRETLDQDARGRYVGRHKTQLATVRSLMAGAIREIRTALQAVDIAAGQSSVYAECSTLDETVVWLHRLWAYVKSKFDQRDDPDKRVRLVLHAADEVIWSCYHQVFARAKAFGAEVRGAPVAHGPHPLAFIEPEYLPIARPSGQPLPKDLSLPAGLDLLGDEFKTLPLPVVRLPPWCIDAPWWLIYVAHEVGHHVQYDLGLVRYTREALVEATAAAGLQDDEAERWGRWGPEVFADLFSVMMAGPWAIWALAEAAWSSDRAMARPSSAYPPAVVRLALMATTAERLGTADPAALRGLDLARIAATRARTLAHMRAVPAAVDHLLGPLPGRLRTLDKLCRVDPAAFTPTGAVARGARALRGVGTLSKADLGRLESARTLVSSALCAWATLADKADDDARRAGLAALAERARETLSQTGPAGTRAEHTPAGERPEQGAALGKRLLAASRRLAEGAPDDA